MSFWFEFHADLPRHPKTLELQHLMGCSNREAVGIVAVLLCWVGEFGMLGDLSLFTDDQLGAAMGYKPGEESAKVCRALEHAKWIEIGPGARRIHEWTDYTKRWLGDNLFKHDRVALKRIIESYRKEYPESDDEKNLLDGKPSSARRPENVAVAKEILQYLNTKANRNYRMIPQHLDDIAYRFMEVHGDKQGILEMIDRMIKLWGNDPRMCAFLRPATLFNKTVFSNHYDQRNLPLKPVVKQTQSTFGWKKGS